MSDEATSQKASWKGRLSLVLPSLELGNDTASSDYLIRGAKAHGDQKPIVKKTVEKSTGREVVNKEVSRSYRFRLNEFAERTDITEISYEEAKSKVTFQADDGKAWFVTTRNEKRFFYKDDLELNGKFIEVPASDTQDKQVLSDAEGTTIEEVDIDPFERTVSLEITEKDTVPLPRISEYKFKDVYMIDAATDEKKKNLGEKRSRVKNLARKLLEHQTALTSFFSWGRGYVYYTAVLYPYEAKDGSLYLLMGLSEGNLILDKTWSLEGVTEEVVAPVPMVAIKRKPKVTISK